MIKIKGLFKAKHKKTGKWIEGFYACKNETTYCVKEDYERFPVKTQHYIIQEQMTDWGLPNEFVLYEIDPDTLCRCSEMRDKNGALIYEHDLVKIDDNVKQFFGAEDGEVEYRFSAFQIDNDNTYSTKLLLYTLSDVYGVFRGEVVGNIFDNQGDIK